MGRVKRVEKNRDRKIRTVGLIGILVNIIFAAIKIVIGTFANSVAIISDAVNNFNDALSSIITLLGIKLARKAPDQNHPLGYGRLEYVSGFIISAIILFAGFEFLKTSIERIISPEHVEFSIWVIIILTFTVVGKLFLARLNITVGKKTKSLALQASGAEAMFDVFASAATIIALVIAKYTDYDIDGYIGLVLSALILFTGVKQIKATISSIIGERPDKELVDSIRKELKKHKEIIGVFDFVIHNYGPLTMIGTANLELNDILTVQEAYQVISDAQRDIAKKFNIFFTFGIYSVNTHDKEITEMYDTTKEILKGIPHVVGFHGFYVDKKNKEIRFDAVHDFETKEIEKTKKRISDEVKKAYPKYELKLIIDLIYV